MTGNNSHNSSQQQQRLQLQQQQLHHHQRQQQQQHQHHRSAGYQTYCGGCIECYNPDLERLEYDYNYDDLATSSGGADNKSNKPPQPYPRIRERGEYYIDSFNDQPWSWTFGNHESVSLSSRVELS